MQLHCDKRERNSTLPLFPALDWIVETTLHAGDYAISDGDRLYFVFERKTWQDLAASIKDGRAHAQREKLLKMACPAYLLIEGKIGYTADHLVGKMEFSKLESFMMDSVIMGLPVIQTRDKYHTVDYLVKFTERVMKKGGRENKVGNMAEVKEKKKSTVTEQVDEILRAIPGCSQAAVPTLRKIPIVKLFSMGEEDIAELKYVSGRRFGPAMAAKILGVLGNETQAAKVLAAVNGISLVCAKFILEQTSFREFLIEGRMDVMASEKKKLGPIMQNKLKELFNHCSD
jgi:ERCC4-type nuclease